MRALYSNITFMLHVLFMSVRTYIMLWMALVLGDRQDTVVYEVRQ